MIKFHALKFCEDFYFRVFNFAIFFTIAKTRNWRLTKFSYRYDTLFTYVLFTVKIPLKKEVNVIFQVPSCFKRCEYKSKSGRFLWQSEEYSLKTVQLLLSVLVGSIDEDSTLLIYDLWPAPVPKRNGLCVTIGIDRRYCPVKVFCFLQNGRRKRKLVTTVVLRQSTSPYKQRTQDVKDEFVTDVGCIRKCVKTEFISQ